MMAKVLRVNLSRTSLYTVKIKSEHNYAHSPYMFNVETTKSAISHQISTSGSINFTFYMIRRSPMEALAKGRGPYLRAYSTKL